MISVLLPMHNAAATVEAALASLLAQTQRDLEILVIDDGSTDASCAIVRAANDPRVRVVEAGRVGLVRALNTGLELANGAYVARMDADDWAMPDRLARQAAFLDVHPEVGIVGAQVECFGDSVGQGFLAYVQWQNALVSHEAMVRERFIESPLAHPSVMLRRSIVRELGGYADLGWPEDYDLWLRAVHAGVRLAKVPEVLLRWRDHPGRLTRQNAMYAVEALRRCKAHHLVAGPLAGKSRVIVWGAGPLGTRLARELLREGAVLTAFIDVDPRKIGSTRQGLPVVAPASLSSLQGDFLIAAVGAPGARAAIRQHLNAMGYDEGRDYLCAA